MSKVFFAADPHFGHKNMASYRGFQDEFYHDEHIVSQWNKVVSKRDVVYLLGDITMENKRYEILSRLNGVINVVLGNHDMKNHVPELLKYVNSVCGCFSYKGYLITHIPVHPMEFEYRVKGNIHGHIHSKIVKKGYMNVPDNRYKCVSMEQINYTPIEFNKLIN